MQTPPAHVFHTVGHIGTRFLLTTANSTKQYPESAALSLAETWVSRIWNLSHIRALSPVLYHFRSYIFTRKLRTLIYVSLVSLRLRNAATLMWLMVGLKCNGVATNDHCNLSVVSKGVTAFIHAFLRSPKPVWSHQAGKWREISREHLGSP
jgi:hypothetical protein